MRECFFILPLSEGEARAPRGVNVELVHGQLGLDLARAFGGFTSWPVSGAWINPAGELIQDQSRAYLVSLFDDRLPDGVNTLRNIAIGAACAIGQASLYFREPDSAYLIDCANYGAQQK